MKLAVIGAGAAGTAAAWAAADAGAEVTLVHDRAGATALYGGAVDLRPWQTATLGPLDPSVVEFAGRLDLWSLPEAGVCIATGAPRLRPARGADRALLDLEALAGSRIVVADAAVDGWDAPLVADALNQSDWARRTHTCAEVVEVPLLETEAASRFSSYDLARLHDDPARADRVARMLREAATQADAWLLGPWLGTDLEAARHLAEQVSVPVGETTSPPGGAAGARFERARDRLVESAGIRVVRARVTRLHSRDGAWSVDAVGSVDPDGADAPEPVLADAVVLAVGGLISGGVRLRDAGASGSTGSDFDLSLEAPVCFELDGQELRGVSSLHGVDLQAWGMGSLERVGIVTDAERVRGAPGLLAAGSVVAGRPRTVLEAVRAGIAAARAALG